MFYLKIELTEDEERQLREIILDKYGSKNYTLESANFNDFLSQSNKKFKMIILFRLQDQNIRQG